VAASGDAAGQWRELAPRTDDSFRYSRDIQTPFLRLRGRKTPSTERSGSPDGPRLGLSRPGRSTGRSRFPLDLSQPRIVGTRQATAPHANSPAGGPPARNSSTCSSTPSTNPGGTRDLNLFRHGFGTVVLDGNIASDR